MTSEQKKIEKLYLLLELPDVKKDSDKVAALRWAISELEKKYK